MSDVPRTQNPFRLLLRALRLWFGRRVHFRRALSDCQLVDGGEKFVAFRKVLVTPEDQRGSQRGAIFRVRFRFKNLSSKANRRLSLIPIPFILAQPGFRSKTWLLGEQTGDFIGLYEFDSVADADAYWDSLPLRLMRRRAAPDSLSYEVRAVTAGPCDALCAEAAS